MTRVIALLLSSQSVASQCRVRLYEREFVFFALFVTGNSFSIVLRLCYMTLTVHIKEYIFTDGSKEDNIAAIVAIFPSKSYFQKPTY